MLDLLNLLKKLFQLALACMCSVRFLCLSKVLVQFSSRSRSFLTDPQGSAFLPPGPGASPLLVCHMLLPQSTRLIVHHSPSSRGCRLAQNNLATWRPHLDSGPYVASKEKKGHLKRHLRYISGATSWESKKIYTVYHSTITYPRLQVPSRKETPHMPIWGDTSRWQMCRHKETRKNRKMSSRILGIMKSCLLLFHWVLRCNLWNSDPYKHTYSNIFLWHV